MKKKVVLYKSIPEQYQRQLEQHFDLQVFDGVNDTNRSEFEAALSDAEGAIGASVEMPPQLLETASNLQALSTISVGTDQFDLDYLAKRGIPLMHTPSVLTETTADTVFMQIMCAARRAVELSNMVREGKWTKSIGEELYGVDVHGKTLGIIGMGRIGYAVARRAHLGFNMDIQYCNRSAHSQAEQDLNATRTEMDTLLKTSDFVCVMVPLTAETERLIGKAQFALMKPSAIFVNGSRGKVVDESALIEALSQGQIRAAGLDVFEVEPLPGDSPLCKLDNAVIFPHIGSATGETREQMVACAVDNIIAALQGDIARNCANRHLLNRAETERSA